MVVERSAKGRRPRGGLVEKREAILRGALTVFAQDGYTRASIEAISSAAGVSTRTIYNHFEDKAQLFQAVIQGSAARVAESQIAVIEKHLDHVQDLEKDLIAFGMAWVTPMADYADHFALVKQINAESGHIPAEAIEAWQKTGPLRVRRELAYRMMRLADRGLLKVRDADRAALHFGLLISVADPAFTASEPTPEEIEATVVSGVHAFLHGYLG
ncbi:TetR/AcrR family transcriptional regulator [Streptomyces sp. NPDC015346]|uniref:TetR/AcrR family transcriptional regulator n=1 Tax=Streptomyces sp. NPDC015346 TaxID=3364954 RepID=UPI0036F8FA1A